MRIRLKVEPANSLMSNLARCLEEVVPPEIGEGLLGFQILDTIKDRLAIRIGISLKIPMFLIRKVKMLINSASRPPHTW